MSEHLTTQQIENFTAHRLTTDELVTVSRHLAMCSDCRQLVNARTRTWQRVASLQSSFRTEGNSAHLSYEQLAAYVDNEADNIAREISANHLAICQQCTDVMQELQALRVNLQTPAVLPARKTFVEWWREVWPAPAMLRPMFLVAAAVMLFVVIVWWARRPSFVPEQTPEQIPEQSVAVAQPSPTIASPAPSVVASVSPTPTETPVVNVSLQDSGATITLDQAGNIAGLTTLSKEAERALRQALTTQQIETPAELKSLIRRPATLMGNTPDSLTIQLLSPIGTFIKDAQPTFHWQKVKGAQSYAVTVLDANFNAVATSPALTNSFWRMTTPLQRGQEYLWQVTADVDGKRVTSASTNAPEAHFKLLSADRVRELQLLVQTNRSHLLRGTMYAKAGLLDEAEQEYQALLKSNPHSIIVRKLLQRLRAVRKS